ncbi:TorD/DmsD family molecular chaperone [Massilia sp. PWRC2]|uniref:TorD/DmsD family molecular chaperone n=1 Tax=Massilia sp. PWRC2 TaxID=2804626 RepID=UPI003CF2E766
MQQFGNQQEQQTTFVAVGMPLPQEDQARANIYGLLARLLLAPPDAGLLDSLAASDALVSESGAQPLDVAWDQLSVTARLLPTDHVIGEYNDLFVSTAAPRVSPHGSIYLAGFLHEKPLVLLRADLAKLGLGRRAGVRETEDHLGALCETMRQLISRKRTVDDQHAFFDKHIGSWYVACLHHLRRAEGAQFYARVADLAEAFFSLEQQAFQVAEDDA